jgi:hypothetical protein
MLTKLFESFFMGAGNSAHTGGRASQEFNSKQIYPRSGQLYKCTLTVLHVK